MIAYIDDASAARKYFEIILKKLGYEVETFESVEAFQGEFSHVFTDLKLVDTYQWETIKELQKKYKGKITVLSGLGNGEDMRKTYTQYGVGFIHKDELEPEKIRQAIEG